MKIYAVQVYFLHSRGFVCDEEGFSWNLLEAIKLICNLEEVTTTEHKCKELLVSKHADQRLACLNKLTARQTAYQVCLLFSFLLINVRMFALFQIVHDLVHIFFKILVSYSSL